MLSSCLLRISVLLLIIGPSLASSPPRRTLYSTLTESGMWSACKKTPDSPDCRKFRSDWVTASNVILSRIALAASSLRDGAEAVSQQGGNTRNSTRKTLLTVRGSDWALPGSPPIAEPSDPDTPGLFPIFENLRSMLSVVADSLDSHASNFTETTKLLIKESKSEMSKVGDAVGARLQGLRDAREAAVAEQTAKQNERISRVSISTNLGLADEQRQAAAIGKDFREKLEQETSEWNKKNQEVRSMLAAFGTAAAAVKSGQLRLAKSIKERIKSEKSDFSDSVKDFGMRIRDGNRGLVQSADLQARGIFRSKAEEARTVLSKALGGVAEGVSESEGKAAEAVGQARETVGSVSSQAEDARDALGIFLSDKQRAINQTALQGIDRARAVVKDAAEESARISSAATAEDWKGSALGLAAGVNEAEKNLRQNFARSFSGLGDQAGAESEGMIQKMRNFQVSSGSAIDQYVTHSTGLIADSSESAGTVQLKALEAFKDGREAVQLASQITRAQLDATAHTKAARTRQLAVVAASAISEAADAAVAVGTESGIRGATERANLGARLAQSRGEISIKTLEQAHAADLEASRVRSAVHAQVLHSQATAGNLGRATISVSNAAGAVAAMATESLGRVGSVTLQTQSDLAGLSQQVAGLGSAEVAAEAAAQAASRSAISSAVSGARLAQHSAISSRYMAVRSGLASIASDAAEFQSEAEKMSRNFQVSADSALNNAEDFTDVAGRLKSANDVQRQHWKQLASSRAASEAAEFQAVAGESEISSTASNLTESEQDAAVNEAAIQLEGIQRESDSALSSLFPEITSALEFAEGAITKLLLLDNDLKVNMSRVNVSAAELRAKVGSDGIESRRLAQSTAAAAELAAIVANNASNKIRAEISRSLQTVPITVALALGNYSANVSVDISDFGRFVRRLSEAVAEGIEIQRNIQLDHYLRLMSAVTGQSEEATQKMTQRLSLILSSAQISNENKQAILAACAGCCSALRQVQENSAISLKNVGNMLEGGQLEISQRIVEAQKSLNQGASLISADHLSATLLQYRTLLSEVARKRMKITKVGDHIAELLEGIETGGEASRESMSAAGKAVFALGAAIHALDAESRNKVLTYLRMVANGAITMDEAIAAARAVNFAEISTVEDAVLAMSGAMSNYSESTRNLFTEMHATVKAFREYASYRSTDAILYNGAMLGKIFPTLEQAKFKEKLLKRMTETFLASAEPRALQVEANVTRRLDVFEQSVRDLRDVIEAAKIDFKAKERDEKVMVENLMTQEKQVIRDKLNALRSELFSNAMTS